jgi:hypothetical protein
MAGLEKYHDAGALELIVTSTLPRELDKGSIQARKARLYHSIGGDTFAFSGEREFQSLDGAPVRSSLFPLLYTELFGGNLKGKALRRALRDCLHLDQAQMNAADIFVSNDKSLHGAQPILEKHGVHLLVYTPERALEHILSYFGGDNLELIKAQARDQGPVILGSNTCADCSFIAARAEETLARIQLKDGLVHFSARFRDENGRLLVELKPGEPPDFHVELKPGELPQSHVTGPRVRELGSGPILVTNKPVASAVVSSDERTYLAVRTTHTRRAVISHIELRDQVGQLVVQVQRETLVLRGASATFGPWTRTSQRTGPGTAGDCGR